MFFGFRGHSTTAQPAKQNTSEVKVHRSLDALASDVIPAVTATEVVTERLKPMNHTLLTAVQKWFSDVEQNPLFSTTELLYPS